MNININIYLHIFNYFFYSATARCPGANPRPQETVIREYYDISVPIPIMRPSGGRPAAGANGGA